MSVNHFSQDLQEAIWWRSQPQEPPAYHPHHHHHQQAWISHPYHVPAAAAHGLGFNLNRCGEDDESSELEEQVVEEMNAAYNCIRDHREGAELEKEALFEKPLTPSDVGKLNRLVIPKQHAEKYFPLASKSGDKGLILSFEDESGKCWRFRYSYWSSSQSYVLTKGWSRYVKEKRLDAGDIILFERHCIDMDRLFIGWRRRGEEFFPAAQPTPTSTKSGFCNSATDCTPHPGSAIQNRTAAAGSNSRTLRLFGVNMECQLDESEPSTPDGSSLSSHGLGHQPIYSQPSHYYSPDLHQMDIAFTQAVNLQHMRNRRG